MVHLLSGGPQRLPGMGNGSPRKWWKGADIDGTCGREAAKGRNEWRWEAGKEAERRLRGGIKVMEVGWSGRGVEWKLGGVEVVWSGSRVEWKWGGVDVGWSGSGVEWTWGGVEVGWSGSRVEWKWGGVDVGWKWCGVKVGWSGSRMEWKCQVGWSGSGVE